MKYLREFNNHSDYEDAKNSGELFLPNVSLCNEGMGLHYNPMPTWESYVQDGLVFQLDGINKGDSEDQTTWVDIKGNKVLTSVGTTPTLMSNCWNFNGDGYFEYNGLLSASEDITLEICSTIVGMGSIIHNGTWNNNNLFFYPLGDTVWFLQRNVGFNAASLVGNRSKYYNKDTTISLNLDRFIIGDTIITDKTSSTNFFSDPNKLQVGQYRGAYHSGKIYAIRVYNRKLTEEEQRYNIFVDSKRFDFSLY